MALIINGEFVDDSVVRREAGVLRQQYAGAIDGDPFEVEIQLRNQARENVIDQTLLRQEAARDPAPIAPERIAETFAAIRSQSVVKAGCDPRANDDELRREIEARLRVDRLFEKIGARLARPRQAEVSEYYRKHRDEFLLPEMVRASHIVKNIDENNTEEAALEAIRAVESALNAENFAALADQYSDCRGNGGDLGYFPRGQMVEEFDEVVFGMRTGETSGIFRTPFGFHILRLVDRRAEGLRSLAEVKDEIAARLHHEKLARAVTELIDRLRAKAEIQNVRQKTQA
jgi:parvulin-like peptidyl-prolyl isomerase